MITLAQYFGVWFDNEDATDERKAAAGVMLAKVNTCLNNMVSSGISLNINPKTQTLVSGETYGGFRPQNCPIGAAHSSHKEGRAVDIYDPGNVLDNWLNDSLLTQFGLYREAPAATPHWLHLTDRSPGSGLRTFNP